MLVTCLSVLNACLIGVLIIFLYKFKANVPVLLQECLNDVGDQFSEMWEKPQVKRAMSVLGSKSGEVRASAALKNRVAEKALGQNIILKKALDYFEITPLEGLQLINDPTIGPVIRSLMSGLAKGGLGKGFNSPGGGGRGNVPNMS